MEVKNIQQSAISLKPVNKKTFLKDIESDPEYRDAKLRKTAEEFESIFLTQLFKTMEKTITLGGVTGENKSSNLSGMMFSQVLGKAVAGQGGIGMAESIYSSLKQLEGLTIDEFNKKQMNELDK